MPLGFLSISGLSHNQANDGYPIAAIPGDIGGVVTDCVLIASADGLPPSDPSIAIQVFPGTHFTTGTDSLGQISATITLANLNGDGKTWTPAGGGVDIIMADGFWEQLIRGTVNSTNGTRGFDIQFLTLGAEDFTDLLTRNPEDLSSSDTSWNEDEEQGQTELSFSYDNADNEDPIGFTILRDGEFVGYIPWTDGTTDYTYTDYVFVSGTYTYTIKAYKLSPNALSPASNSEIVTFGGATPDINITMGLNIDIAWVSTFVFIADPSGIYTLVPGKTHDTLYERTDVDHVDVKIPRPFIKTAYLGD